MLNRRQWFASSAAAGCLAGMTTGGMSRALAGEASTRKKRIAFLGTDVYQHSHAQHFLDRFSMGYAMHGVWREPEVELASVYLDQFNERDLGRARLTKYGLHQAESIEDALTLGGGQLAVDGVIIIGEHGNYPKNEKGQKLYPRYDWFRRTCEVFRESGRSVPVFNDKHLSTSWDECLEMVELSRELEFPFYAGSSLPVTWRLPEFELPLDTPMLESVCVAYGGVDSYDFHALETAQCISERRAGGEVGVRSVQAAKGDKLWSILGDRDVTRQLFVSALCRSHSLPVETGYPSGPITYEWAKKNLPNTIGYFVQHLDGFWTSIFLTGIRDFNYAGMRSDTNEIVGCQMMLPMPGRNATTADFFNPLSRQVERMFVDGTTAYPVERTLLTSGMVIGGVESLFADQTLFETDSMDIAYKAPEGSMFWRNDAP